MAFCGAFKVEYVHITQNDATEAISTVGNSRRVATNKNNTYVQAESTINTAIKVTKRYNEKIFPKLWQKK